MVKFNEITYVIEGNIFAQERKNFVNYFQLNLINIF